MKKILFLACDEVYLNKALFFLLLCTSYFSPNNILAFLIFTNKNNIHNVLQLFGAYLIKCLAILSTFPSFVYIDSFEKQHIATFYLMPTHTVDITLRKNFAITYLQRYMIDRGETRPSHHAEIL